MSDAHRPLLEHILSPQEERGSLAQQKSAHGSRSEAGEGGEGGEGGMGGMGDAPPQPPAEHALSPHEKRGPIAWMARNSVASNLLMFALMFGGLMLSTRVKQELFPEFTLDIVSIEVPYPAASPAVVEQQIVRIIEESVSGLDGVKKVTARAATGLAGLTVELIEGTDGNQALVDIKSAVDRVAFRFPQEAEEHNVRLVQNRSRSVSLVIHGQKSEEALRALAEATRDALLKDKRITLVELTGTRDREIDVTIPQAVLRAHDLSLGQVADVVRQSSVELPAGTLKTAAGQVQIRTTEQRDFGSQIADIPVIDSPDGARLTIGDLGGADDTFRDEDLALTFNGEPAVQIDVFRVGRESPITVSEAVFEYIEGAEKSLPAGVSFAVWNDRAEMYRGRIDLLTNNALLGLVLVLLALGLFLETKLAFWVMMGIPISFLGAFLLMPTLDISINMISMFAFIVTLGIVVDDAIVVGENIFEMRSQGMPPQVAAVRGARQVAVPVTFAVLTTVATFSPLFFVPGASGKFFRVIPGIVVAVLIISLIESLYVLPAHLAHSTPTSPKNPLSRVQRRVAQGLNWFIERIFQPAVRAATAWRYTTVAVAIALFMCALGVVAGRHIGFTPMPRVEGDIVGAIARLPVGSTRAEAEALRATLQATADAVIAEVPGGPDIVRGAAATVGVGLGLGGGPAGSQVARGTHVVEMAMHLVSSEKRDIGAMQVARMWRAKNQDLTGLDSITFSAALRTGGGAAIDVVLSHRDVGVLEEAAAKLGTILEGYDGVTDVDNGFAAGMRQMDMTLRPHARALGLTERALAVQVRNAFFGAEAVRQQRERDEVRIMVRLPKADRETMAAFEGLILRTPSGGEIPLADAVDVLPGRADTAIIREDGRRIIHVTADVVDGVTTGDNVVRTLAEGPLNQLVADHPGLSYNLGGQAQDWAETYAALKVGFPLALFAVFCLLAVPFKSYAQPLIIMGAIPFGFVGAVLGHLITGYDLSIISMMGVVALSGIVVNDSLILVVSVNERRAQGVPIKEAVIQGAMRRFRPILLTSLTTFFGLLPMIFEPSVQARFLIPMAVSLGFGVLFATFLILLVVPALYVIVEDFRVFFGFVEPDAALAVEQTGPAVDPSASA